VYIAEKKPREYCQTWDGLFVKSAYQMPSKEFEKNKENKCFYCNLMIKNKVYMKHLAEQHRDPKAIAILKEWGDLE